MPIVNMLDDRSSLPPANRRLHGVISTICSGIDPKYAGVASIIINDWSTAEDAQSSDSAEIRSQYKKEHKVDAFSGRDL